MKKNIPLIVSCLLILGITGSCKSKFDEKKYLTKILNNLEQIKSISYFHTMVWNEPGDTVPSPFRRPYEYYNKEFANPADTATGVSIGEFEITDTTRLYRSYDKNVYISLRDYDKTISIDSSLFRLPIKAFFNSAQNIIKYALTTNDSILKEVHDFGDSLLFRLTVYSNKRVMLGEKRPLYVSPGDEIKISKYDIWINKTTGLPYKSKTTWSDIYYIYWEDVSDVQINTMDIKDFIPARYLPADYDIEVKGRIVSPLNLMGQTISDWTLSDYNNELFALKDFTSKILLIKFSGIGCGPCYAALPFLKQLAADYNDKSFEIVHIECWSKNVAQIEKYISTNDIKYKLLISDDKIQKIYNVLAVPTFIILDNNRTIQHVQRGYSKEVDEEIIKAIEKLL